MKVSVFGNEILKKGETCIIENTMYEDFFKNRADITVTSILILLLIIVLLLVVHPRMSTEYRIRTVSRV